MSISFSVVPVKIRGTVYVKLKHGTDPAKAEEAAQRLVSGLDLDFIDPSSNQRRYDPALEWEIDVSE